VSSKKGELKIEFDTRDTRDTHDTSPEKVEWFLYFSFVTWNVKSTWGSWIYLLIWHLKMLDFGGLRSGPSFKNQVFWHKNGHLLATENGMSYLCTVIRKGHETDKKNFFGGRNFVRPPTNRILSVECLGKHPERPPAAVTWANRRPGHDESDKPTGEVLGADVNVNVQFNNDGNADFSDNTNAPPTRSFQQQHECVWQTWKAQEAAWSEKWRIQVTFANGTFATALEGLHTKRKKGLRPWLTLKHNRLW